MTKKIDTEQAKSYLSDCPSEKSFWVNNGPILKNICELSTALKAITDEQFTHHVNKEKNDFSKWVEEVLGDGELAKNLQKAKSKTATIKKINERIENLRKTAS